MGRARLSPSAEWRLHAAGHNRSSPMSASVLEEFNVSLVGPGALVCDFECGIAEVAASAEGLLSWLEWVEPWQNIYG